MALTTGFMCIVACDCNQRPELSLEFLSIDVEHAQRARDYLCEFIPWGEVDFSQINSDTEELAKLSFPILNSVCECL